MNKKYKTQEQIRQLLINHTNQAVIHPEDLFAIKIGKASKSDGVAWSPIFRAMEQLGFIAKIEVTKKAGTTYRWLYSTFYITEPDMGRVLVRSGRLTRITQLRRRKKNEEAAKAAQAVPVHKLPDVETIEVEQNNKIPKQEASRISKLEMCMTKQIERIRLLEREVHQLQVQYTE